MNRQRKGITPVVAIVLVLMMTVAIASAAGFWINGILQDEMDEGGTQLSTEMNLVGLDCEDGDLNWTITNVGDAEVDATNTVISAFNTSTDNLVTTTTRDGGILASGDVWTSTGGYTGEYGFLPTSEGTSYEIEFEFASHIGNTVRGMCET